MQPKTRARARGTAITKLVKSLRELPDNGIQFIQDVTDKLTVTRILLVLLASILATVAVLLYENRNLVLEAVIQAVTTERKIIERDVSKESKVQIIKMVRNSDLLNFILVTQIDLQKNRRHPRFWYLESAQEEKIRNKAALLVPQPVFNEDGQNTQQILSVLNTEFVCVPTKDTIFYKLFPEIEPEMPLICRMSIPPIYGHVNGILTFGLTRKPNQTEMISLRQMASEISNQIYMRDIIKKPVPHV